MELVEHEAGSVRIFETRGRLTLESFGALKDRVRALVERGGRALVVDVSGLTYVDSIGVSELVRSHVIMQRADGRLVLAAVPDHLRRLLSVTMLDQIFECASSRSEATERLAA